MKQLYRKTALVILVILANQYLFAQINKPFSVVDSVSLTLPGYGASTYSGGLKTYFGGGGYEPSPNGKWVVFTTSRRNIQTNLRQFSLFLFEVKEILDFVNNSERKQLPSQRKLFTFETESSEEGIQEMSWLPDSSGVVFLGVRKEAKDIAQVYRYDLAANRLDQITKHPRIIHSFQYSHQSGMLVFSADSPPDWSDRYRRGFVVQNDRNVGSLTLLSETIAGEPSRAMQLCYYAMNLHTGRTIELKFDEPRYGMFPEEVSISPDGKFALRTAGIWKIPKHWLEYNDSSLLKYLNLNEKEKWENEAFGGDLPIRRYVLMDLEKGTSKPLIDSPKSSGPQQIRWSKDSKSISLKAFMPLVEVNDNERVRRIEKPFDVVINILDGSFEELSDSRQSQLVEKLSTVKIPLQIWWVNNPETPPNLEATDTSTNRKRLITNLNPQLSLSNYGTVSDFVWEDQLERKWKGDLLLPKNFDSNHRYPILIQLNGTRESGLTFGMMPFNSHPGLSMLERNIVVLSLSCTGAPQDKDLDIGLSRSAITCVEGAVDTLDRKGIIDRHRVGLTGFSFAGDIVHNIITFSKYAFAAASIVDSTQSTFWAYSMFYSYPRPGMKQWDEPTEGVYPKIGTQFYGEGVKRWIERSPMFNLDRIRTPIRYEYHGDTYPPGSWDTFVVLKRANRPIELVQFAKGEHDLKRPVERFTSTQAIVDWFAFWLTGDQRTVPIPNTPETASFLSEQYERWRALRRQQEMHLEEIRAKGINDNSLPNLPPLVSRK